MASRANVVFRSFGDEDRGVGIFGVALATPSRPPVSFLCYDTPMKERILEKIDLEGRETLLIKEGITEKQIRELLAYSQSDQEIRKFTSDPVRFKDRNAFNQWRQKGKLIYTLTDVSGPLLGLIWFGEKACPFKEELGCQTSFAIRIYGKARGKGLAIDFMKIAFSDYCRLHPETGGIWLETSVDNLAARKVYEKFGFQAVPEAEDKKKIIMTFKPRK